MRQKTAEQKAFELMIRCNRLGSKVMVTRNLFLDTLSFRQYLQHVEGRDESMWTAPTERHEVRLKRFKRAKKLLEEVKKNLLKVKKA